MGVVSSSLSRAHAEPRLTRLGPHAVPRHQCRTKRATLEPQWKQSFVFPGTLDELRPQVARAHPMMRCVSRGEWNALSLGELRPPQVLDLCVMSDRSQYHGV